MKKTFILCITVLLTFVLGFAIGYVTFEADEPEVQIAKDVESVEEASGMPAPPSEAEKENENTDEAENAEIMPQIPVSESMRLLKEKIETELLSYEGDWAVYVENLGSGEKISVNSKKMVSASLIKIFIMAKVYDEIAAGTIAEEEVSDDLYNMITVSDNEASNRLVAKLGGGTYVDMYGEAFQAGLAEVNGYALSIGCADTEQQRDMKNFREIPVSEENYTSVDDCGLLLGNIYRSTAVNAEYSTKMLELLRKQTRRWKIPAGLPAGTDCANKTGELSNVENDIALVFTPGADYVICVMSNNITAGGEAQANISKISSMVYSHFQEAVPKQQTEGEIL